MAARLSAVGEAAACPKLVRCTDSRGGNFRYGEWSQFFVGNPSGQGLRRLLQEVNGPGPSKRNWPLRRPLRRRWSIRLRSVAKMPGSR